MADSPSVQWHYDENHDVKDGQPWSQDELDDLALALKDGGSIEVLRISSAGRAR